MQKKEEVHYELGNPLPVQYKKIPVKLMGRKTFYIMSDLDLCTKQQIW